MIGQAQRRRDFGRGRQQRNDPDHSKQNERQFVAVNLKPRRWSMAFGLRRYWLRPA
jgi:hypothetical protein